VKLLGGWSVGADLPLLTLADVPPVARRDDSVAEWRALAGLDAAAKLASAGITPAPPPRPCECRRILVDTGHLGAPAWHLEHDWLDDGRVCCLERAAWKGQLCWCRASQWVPNE
jgi:hypothetical protein